MCPISHSCSLVLQISLITMLTVITWNQDSKKLHECSREKSAIVREVITKKLMPIFEQQQGSIPKECPFHPERDYLWWPPVDDPDDSEHTAEKQTGWCPFCGDNFGRHDRLTAHWDQVHRDGSSESYRDDLVCLADYCDIFRCDVLIRKRIEVKKKRSSNVIDYLASSFGDHDTTTYTSVTTSGIAACEPYKMAQIEQSCRNVVRQCTIGIEANFSAPQFAAIENEMTASLCSFLNCKHYADDLFAEDDQNASRKVPITLFSVFGVIVASGFCVCYYVIWTFIQRLLATLSDQSSAVAAAEIVGSENKLKLSFDDKQDIDSNTNNTAVTGGDCNKSTQSASKTRIFFRNLFEFRHRDAKNEEEEEEEEEEDERDDLDRANLFEFNDFSANSADYERKLRSISSIIIEEEDEERGDDGYSEHDISFASYPIVSGRRVSRRTAARPASLGAEKASKSSKITDHVSRSWNSIANANFAPNDNHKNDNENDDHHKHHHHNQTHFLSKPNESKKITTTTTDREIFLQDLPMKIHSRYVQPFKLKHSYSDRDYPSCYCGAPPPAARPSLSKSRSYSHSHLRNASGGPQFLRRPPRQESFDETKWEDRSDSHSSMSIKSTRSMTSKVTMPHDICSDDHQSQGVPRSATAYNHSTSQTIGGRGGSQSQYHHQHHHHYQQHQQPHQYHRSRHFDSSSPSNNSNMSNVSRTSSPLGSGSRIPLSGDPVDRRLRNASLVVFASAAADAVVSSSCETFLFCLIVFVWFGLIWFVAYHHENMQ